MQQVQQIIPTVIRRSDLRGQTKLWPSRPMMREFMTRFLSDGAATYQSGLDQNGNPELKFPEMVAVTRNLILSNKRILTRHGMTPPGTRLYQDNGEADPVVYGPVTYPHQDYPKRNRPSVMAFINQQRHGNYFKRGGERQLVFLENPEVQAYIRSQSSISSPLRHLPANQIHQLTVPEGVPFAAIIDDARVGHGAKLIEIDPTHPLNPGEGRLQTILEFH